jgi:biofilm PGA synthesis protein PgaD
LLAIYSLVICAMGGSLLLWATYNHHRFWGVDRRQNAEVPSTSAIGAYIHHPGSAIDTWRSYTTMAVEHDDHGGTTQVKPGAVLRA